MDDYGIDYGALKPGLYLQRGPAVKRIEVAKEGDSLNFWKIFGLEKVDDDTLVDRETWTSAAITNRAETLIGTPHAWMVGEEELEDVPFGINEHELLPQIDRAMQTKKHGAFLQKVRQRGGLLSRLVWLDPDTMEPDLDTATHEEGIKYFIRTVNARPRRIPASDIIWFKRPGMRELASGEAPLEASRLDAEILYNLRRMMDSFYEGNGLPIMMVMVPAGTTQAEVDRMESYFSRVVNFLRGTRQVKTIAVREGVTVQVLSFKPNDMDLDATDKRHGLSVLRNHHVPHSIVDSNAANYATAISDQIRFAQTMATRLEAIAETLNRDADFQQAGVRLEVQRSQITTSADDTVKLAQAFQMLVAAGLPVDIAAEHVGIELPDDFELPEPEPEPEPIPEQFDLSNDRIDEEMKKLDNFLRNGSHYDRMFRSDVLTPDAIKARIEQYEYDRLYSGEADRPETYP